MSRKSQITIFIILGVLFIFSLVFLFYLISSSSEDQTETAQEIVKITETNKEAVNKYVTQCLDKTLKEGVVLITSQAGFIYKGQKGSMIDLDIPHKTVKVAGKTVNVTFLIYEKEEKPFSTAPYYPCYNGLLTTMNYTFKGEYCYADYYNNKKVGFQFGTPLQDNNSRKISPGLCNQGTPSYSSYLCSCNDKAGSPYDCQYSIQRQLETYIETNIADCIDFSFFYDSLGLKVSNDEYYVNVSIADNDVSARLFMPIVGSSEEAPETIKSLEFYSITPIRLKTLYALLHGTRFANIKSDMRPGSPPTNGLIWHDTNDINFDIVSDGNKLIRDLGLLNITIQRFPISTFTVIKITDYGREKGNTSVTSYKPIELYFARENRRPALNFIRQKTAPGETYNILNYESNRLYLMPIALDPDEDPLTYSYSGWRQDYDEVYDPVTRTKANTTVDPDKTWMKSDAYIYGSDCFFSEEEKLNKTGRCAFIDLYTDDLGIHEMKVSVYDSTGKTDYQELNLFIDDLPNASFETTHIYASQFNSFYPGFGFIASIEDPFILNSSSSYDRIRMTPSDLYFWWNDSNPELNDALSGCESDYTCTNYDNFKLPHNRTHKYVVYPIYNLPSTYDNLTKFLDDTKKLTKNYYSYSITNYKNTYESLLTMQYYQRFNISKKHGYFGPLGQHTIRLDLLENWDHIDSTTNDVYVAKCFPYRSTIAPYPFNLVPKTASNLDVDYNPYYSNHTCCEGDPSNPTSWEYALEDTPCYESYDYIIREGFENPVNRTYIPTQLEFEFPSGDPDFDECDKSNNPDKCFYTRHMRGECTGQRGNVCKPIDMTIKPFYVDAKVKLEPVPFIKPNCNAWMFYGGEKTTISGASVPDSTGVMKTASFLLVPTGKTITSIDIRLRGEHMVAPVDKPNYEITFIIPTHKMMQSFWNKACPKIAKARNDIESMTGITPEIKVYALSYDPSKDKYEESPYNESDNRYIYFYDNHVQYCKDNFYYNIIDETDIDSEPALKNVDRTDAWSLGTEYIIDDMYNEPLITQVIVPISFRDSISDEDSVVEDFMEIAAENNITVNPLLNMIPGQDYDKVLKSFSHVEDNAGRFKITQTSNADDLEKDIFESMLVNIGTEEPFIEINNTRISLADFKIDAKNIEDDRLVGAVWLKEDNVLEYGKYDALEQAIIDYYNAPCPDNGEGYCEIPIRFGSKTGKLYLEYCINYS